MSNTTIVTVAPNGAYKQKLDHPALPMTPREVAEAAQLAAEAGATMIHAHARDEAGRHSLEIRDNRQVWDAIRNRVGEEIVVQLTTEAAGIYHPEQQMAMVREIKPEAASFALKELIPNPAAEAQAQRFFHWVADQGIAAQYILYSAEELRRFNQLMQQGVIPDTPHQLLFVLGRYQQNQQSSPADLQPFMSQLHPDSRWMVCAFGLQEHPCIETAITSGGDARIGFENNLYNAAGETAKDNTELVKQAIDVVRQQKKNVMSAAEYRSNFMHF